MSMSMSRCEVVIDRIQIKVDDSHLLPSQLDLIYTCPLPLSPCALRLAFDRVVGVSSLTESGRHVDETEIWLDGEN